MEKTQILSTKKLAILGLLVAMNIILSRFLSIQAWNIKIGFTFITIVVAAVLYGPVESAVVGGVGDFLGAILFPSGAYFPGFTLTAILTGVVYGCFFRKKMTLPRIFGAVAIVQFVLGMLLNSLWISILYGSPYAALLPVRATQAVLLFIVQSIVIVALREALFKRVKVFVKE